VCFPRNLKKEIFVVDVVSSEKRSQMMAGITGKNTKPEILVRKILHRIGYRFRLHKKDLPGKPDIVLPRYKIAIFVQGCFWHGHENCHLFRLPKSRTEFWEAKIAGNKVRDDKVLTELSQLGYRILEVWECSLKGKSALEINKIENEMHQFISHSDGMHCEIRGKQE